METKSTDDFRFKRRCKGIITEKLLFCENVAFIMSRVYNFLPRIFLS